MNHLPMELLQGIVDDPCLSTQDLCNVARVNHQLHTATCARLYREGDLSYIGVDEKDIQKVDAFARNGRFVRHLKLQLFSRWGSTVDIPTKIWEFLQNFVNLHSFVFIDIGTLPWDQYLSVLAHIVTTHRYLKVLEIQRTLVKSDGRIGIEKAKALIKDQRLCKLDEFTLKLSKKEEPMFLSRVALNHLIEILGGATRSATKFTYFAGCREAPDISLKHNKSDPKAKSWEWDNLEELALKIQGMPFHSSAESLAGNWSLDHDLHNLKCLTLRAEMENLWINGSKMFEGSFSRMKELEKLRVSNAGGSFITAHMMNDPANQFLRMARELPKLRSVQMTDPYYMTMTLNQWKIDRTMDGDIKFVPTC